MKELSIEEKAKRYDKALERSKAVKETYLNLGNISAAIVLESIFPELKESEDEKIRKAIHIYLDWLDGRKDYAPKGVYSIRDMIAWLEKQCEKVIDCPQNHQDVKHPNGCIVLEDFNGGEGFYKLNLDYLNKRQVAEIEELVRTWNTELNSLDNENIRACIGMCLTDADEQRFKNHNTNLNECIAWLDKQGEYQKFANKEYTFKAIPRLLDMIQPTDRAKSYCQKLINSLEQEGYSTDAKIVRNCLKQMNGEKVAMAVMDIKKQGEQKSAWSEEDDHCIELLLPIIDSSSLIPKNRKRCEEFLESLKDRVQPQPNQEWSEEDEKKIMWLVRLVSTAGFRELDNDKMPCSRNELIDWLKSLRPQN